MLNMTNELWNRGEATLMKLWAETRVVFGRLNLSFVIGGTEGVFARAGWLVDSGGAVTHTGLWNVLPEQPTKDLTLNH